MSDDNQKSWRDDIPQEMRDQLLTTPHFAKASSLKEYIDHVSSDAKWRGQSLRIPGKDASDDDMKAFAARAMEKIPGLYTLPGDDADAQRALYRKLGAPEQAEQYTMPEGVTLDTERANALRDQALQANMTQSQFEALANLAGQSVAADNAAAAAFKAEQDKLYGEWGMAYDGKAADIYVLLQQMGQSEKAEMVRSRQLPASDMRMLDQMVKAIGSEGNDMSQMRSNSQQQMVTPAEAQSRIQEILNDGAYFEHGTPKQQALMEEMAKLQSMIAR